ncbi:MAG: hypothetical protein ACI955_001620 [Zhongshania sp.]|jgi:hypothetical protein
MAKKASIALALIINFADSLSVKQLTTLSSTQQ